MTRGEIADEIDELVGEGMATLAHRGLAKVLEDRAEFEVVADVPPEELREKVFTAAAEHRRKLQQMEQRTRFHREEVLARVGGELNIEPTQVVASLFADLKEENRMLRFEDIDAQRLIERYNVALAQAVLLRSTQITVEVHHEPPARYRQLFRWLKFHRLLHRIEGSMATGFKVHIDGPMSLFSATNKYGLQMALFLPALLLCRDFRLDAELRWGPKREPKRFQLRSADGLVSHYQDSGQYVPAEIAAFLERFRQVAPGWDVTDQTDVIELGRVSTWVPDYRFVHGATGTDVYVEILGFWKRGSLLRLLDLLPKHGPPRYVLLISDKLKVDEGALDDFKGPVLRFKEVPNATELASLLDRFPREQGRFTW
jgi:predicted nuclease of restriction endonuclease-like RecB superfamily